MVKFLFFISLSLFFSVLHAQQKEAKCDLFISDIYLKVIVNNSHDRTGMPLINPHKTLKLDIEISNNGPNDFKGIVYLAYTLTEDDAKLKLFNNYIPIGYPGFIIESGSSFIYKKVFQVSANLKQIIFKINEHPDIKKVTPETDLFNNEYHLNVFP